MFEALQVWWRIAMLPRSLDQRPEVLSMMFFATWYCVSRRDGRNESGIDNVQTTEFSDDNEFGLMLWGVRMKGSSEVKRLTKDLISGDE
jgi:hypothetical protein